MKRTVPILPLASALSALAGAATASTIPNSVPNSISTASDQETAGQKMLTPNTIVSTGETLLGFVVCEQPDGTIVAQHASHASHASHHSHYSSR